MRTARFNLIRNAQDINLSVRQSPLFIPSSLRRGFTIIEVAIALGIFAFAIIPVIGLMSTGLKVSKESIDASTTSQIFRLAEARLSTNASTTEMYFSNEGEETNASAAVYQASFNPTNTADAAQGLLVRKMWQVRIVRASATNVIFSTRSIQVSRDISATDFP
jgi:prepilin-type N-terminal cleavage/methylation domain-containing protein